MPTPAQILEVIRAIMEAARAYFEWLMTEEGKAFSKQAMSDRNVWDKFWSDAGTQLQKFFKGEFFK